MRVPELGAVFFHLDGTLMDTAPDRVGALNTVLEEEGRAPVPFAVVRPLVSHGARTLVALFGYLGPEDRPESRGADGRLDQPADLPDWLP